MKRMAGLGLMKILVPQIYIDLRDLVETALNLNEFTPGAVFEEFFEDRMWTTLSENTNKYVHENSNKQKTLGKKILLNC